MRPPCPPAIITRASHETSCRTARTADRPKQRARRRLALAQQSSFPPRDSSLSPSGSSQCLLRPIWQNRDSRSNQGATSGHDPPARHPAWGCCATSEMRRHRQGREKRRLPAPADLTRTWRKIGRRRYQKPGRRRTRRKHRSPERRGKSRRGISSEDDIILTSYGAHRPTPGGRKPRRIVPHGNRSPSCHGTANSLPASDRGRAASHRCKHAWRILCLERGCHETRAEMEPTRTPQQTPSTTRAVSILAACKEAARNSGVRFKPSLDQGERTSRAPRPVAHLKDLLSIGP